MATRVIDNDDGTFALLRDDGKFSEPFIDPDGSYRRQLEANTDPQTGFIATPEQIDAAAPGVRTSVEGVPDRRLAAVGGMSSAAVRTGNEARSKDDAAREQTEAELGPEPQGPGGRNSTGAPGWKEWQVRYNEIRNPPASEPLTEKPETAGEAPPDQAGEQYLVIPETPGGHSTTTTKTKTTESVANRDELLASGKNANEAQAKADRSLVETKATNLVNRAARIAVQKAELEDKAAAANEAKNDIDARVERHAAKLAAERKVPIDSGEAFDDDRKYWAFIAGLGVGMQNLGAALLGQKPVGNPGQVIEDLINRSVKIQLEQKRQNVEGAQEKLASSRQEQLQTERNILRIADQELRLAEQSAETVEELNLIKPMRDQVEANLQANEQQLAIDLAMKERDQTTAVTTPTPGTPARVVSISTARERAAVESEGTTPENVTEYAKERLKTGADGAIDSAVRARSVIEKLANGQDVPGLGPLDEVLTRWGNDREGAAVSQVLGMTLAEFVRAISGAQATDAEAKRLKSVIVGPGWRPTKDTVLRGLALIESSGRSKLQTLNAGYGPESRAYEKVRGMQREGAQLTPEQQRNRDAQLGR